MWPSENATTPGAPCLVLAGEPLQTLGISRSLVARSPLSKIGHRELGRLHFRHQLEELACGRPLTTRLGHSSDPFCVHDRLLQHKLP